MSEITTEELIQISRSMLFKDSENATSSHEWQLCERLEQQAKEIEELKQTIIRWEELGNDEQ